MKESQEILLKVKTSQNKLETDVLKLKEQEEKLISKLNNLINHQNDSILQLNSHFNQLADSTSTQYYKVTDLINDYSQYITKLENNIQNNIIDNLQKLRLDYLKVLKDFEQNLNSPEEKERINKDILLVKYNEMNEMYKEFKEKEINIIQEYLNIVPKELMNKCDEIIENEQIYDHIYKHFYLKKIEVGQYREGILELKRVEEDYNQYKKKITDNELEMAYSSVIYKIFFKFLFL